MTMNTNNDDVTLTREQYKKQQAKEIAEVVDDKAEGNDPADKSLKSKRRKRIRIRFIPIWLRIVIIVLLIAASVTVGAMVGYGVIGDGNKSDVLKKETWTHIIDLISKE